MGGIGLLLAGASAAALIAKRRPTGASERAALGRAGEAACVLILFLNLSARAGNIFSSHETVKLKG